MGFRLPNTAPFGVASRRAACSHYARRPYVMLGAEVFHASAFFQLDGFAVPAPAQITQTVETVE